MESSPPAGWYDDPGGEGLRYWDGAQWTDQTQAALAPEAPARYTPPPAVQRASSQRQPIPPVLWGAVAALPLMIIGAIAPWASVLDGRVKRDGVDVSAGKIVIALAVIAAAFLVVRIAMGSGFWQALVAAALGGIALLISGVNLADIDNVINGLSLVKVSREWGIYLTVLASLGLMVTAALAAITQKR